MAPIHDAAHEGDVEAVKRLVEGDPELVKAPDPLMAGLLPLMRAAAGNHAAVASYLIEQGAPVDATSQHPQNTGGTALSVAFNSRHADVLCVLRDAGANPTIADRHGFSPLQMACREGELEGLRLLLSPRNDRFEGIARWGIAAGASYPGTLFRDPKS